ncbi:MAG: pantoate--beta-alanine ligase [Candidatus Fluviicola riflensis]|nr:MAG: pantoate--beta-alanine ligase [Candidatus Fluviicola riflensis]OGS77451.1 MAG: pantoate--beta-alanine ligase [Candidatus Fluviicola riflensis]OGS84031.1 MAG: pantoate--beta-alanine ligase [Fluviicola sp. RIFCSPHIGHO2_12_FULL_43_24]OGS84518.1 MAG: pantoate--beta-alanine ligase [Fluviicola sp. RIFCSPHIGHO2_01_FULL_43_53]
MKIIESIISLNEALATIRETGKTIGLVPTMGALHEGHMALVERARTMSDVVVVTVFVNPTQFTNSSDLTLYPRTPEKDAALLASHGCDIAFFPSVDEVYPTGYQTPEVPLGTLDKVMEGEFRPGHFKGVVQVVNRFFEVIQPTFAFFGLKDFQQVAVIRFMTDYLKLPVTIVPCPTLREPSGLAMSSRNMRLTAEQLDEAVIIYETLTFAKSLAATHTPSETKKLALEHFSHSYLKMEYFSIVNPQTLEELTDTWVPGATACVAAFCGEVRLIDNMTLN